MSTGRVCVGSLLGLLVGLAGVAGGKAAAGEAPVRIERPRADAYTHSRVLDEVAEEGESRVIVVMGDPSLPEARARDWRQRGRAVAELAGRVMRDAPGLQVKRQYSIFPFLSVQVDEQALRQLRACPAVEGIYPDRRMKATLRQSGPLIGQPTVEAAGYDGAGVGIAILDSGIDYTHPDLGGAAFPNAKVVGGYDFVNLDNDPRDDEGHGTFVAGIAAGTGATNRGIAPGAHLLALKILDANGLGWSTDVIAAVEWCIVNQHTMGGPGGSVDFNIKAINLSLGDASEWTDPEECAADPEGIAIADAVDSGIVVAVAAGNEGYLGGVAIPACVPDALAVGATYDANYWSGVTWESCTDDSVPVDAICCFSNRGELLDVFAPGGLITAPDWGGSYVVSGGTSAATPHVAGAVAVLVDAGVTDPDAIRARLRRTGVQIVDPLTDVQTARIDLVGAVYNTPAVGPADLVVTVVEASSTSALVGDAIDVRVTVQNTGSTASAACTALVVLSANEIVSPYDKVVASVAVPGLAPGASYPSGWVSGVVQSMPAGSYHLGGYADSGYVVTEYDETNNSRMGATVAVAGLSSYVMSSTIPASMLKGQTYGVGVSMWNTGAAAWTTVGGYSLRAVSPEGTARWGTSTVGLPGGQTVAAGGTAPFSFTVTAPSDPGLYPCHWRMARDGLCFGELATGATKVRLIDDTAYGQEFPAVSGDWAAYMDYNNVYRDYGIPAISVTRVPTLTTTTLPEDIPFPTQWDPVHGWYEPVPPYEDFDISNHLFPDISGSWATWVVDDKLRTGDDPDDPYALWYYQVTAYDVQTPSALPRRIVYDNWDCMNPGIDGNLIVWEDYRNDPDRLWNPYDFLSDNGDIFIYDIATQQSYALCTASGPQFAPRISGNLVVWEDWRDLANLQSDIYMYDLSVDTDSDGTPNWKDADRPSPDPAETQVTGLATATEFTSEQWPDVSGRRVVWLDLRRDTGTGTTVDLYLRDLDGTTEAAVATDPSTVRAQPRIGGTRVTWTEMRPGDSDVYWLDVATGAGGLIGSSAMLSGLSGDRVIYEKRRTTIGTPPYEWDVYNVWVQNMLQEGSVAVHTFSDVPGSFWAWRQVEATAANGVVTGFGDGTYQPTWTVTRDQMAVYIARALAGGDANVPAGPATATFSDVAVGTWAFDYVEYCADPVQDIVGGYEDGTYGPGIVVSRGQMAVFIGRAIAGGESFFDTYVPPTTARFPDVATDSMWYPYVEYIAAEGVAGGYMDGLYHPEYSCTRDQMAVYVSRAFDYVFP